MNAFLSIVFSLAIVASSSASPLRVVATTPDLGSLAREIGGDDIDLTVLARPGDDPHFLDAKPSFIRLMSRADVYIETGLDLEVGWAPLLLQGARNARVMPGNPGHIDASTVIDPMEVPTGPVDRSMGDVHPTGNPHYLLDPRAGRAVAGLLRDRFSALRPDRAQAFRERFADFSRRLDEAEARWDARLAPHRGAKLLGDHNLWVYFADRFGLEMAGYLEPKPGVPPTTRHLQHIIELISRERVRAIIVSPYFDQRHADFVARNTGVRIVPLAHQPGSRPSSDGYIGMIDHNVEALASALDGAK